ncbi:transcriptional regulator with XRE-family HTH domain [Mesonia hippocampi]|uniref:Transcriptional regulator with XRE-family HTH domain n=1 Tax=Mesonia hippocampi TaxID=1628250 RepID=A0A840EZ36_9FLAO|nr:helix-turn-helix domain-containing protein [Mesonia hippocampi]MBB4119284.1 transcriptional regulator with XRE-family HTH domain [Mesonia hippocampi]
MVEIGEKIREIRKKKGLSQEALAELAKLNLRTIQRIENNESEPRGQTLNLICEALAVKTEDIFDEGKQRDKNYLIVFHLSVLTFLVIPIGNVIIPLIMWMNKKDKVIGLREVGVSLLNFQLVWSVFSFVFVLLYAFLKIMHYTYYAIPFYLCVGLYLLNILLPVFFAVKTSKGKTGNLYPSIIKLIR